MAERFAGEPLHSAAVHSGGRSSGTLAEQLSRMFRSGGIPATTGIGTAAGGLRLVDLWHGPWGARALRLFSPLARADSRRIPFVILHWCRIMRIICTSEGATCPLQPHRVVGPDPLCALGSVLGVSSFVQGQHACACVF